MRDTTKNWSREKLNPVELISQFWPTATTYHITYDPKMSVGQYKRILQQSHDGTRMFTDEMLQKLLLPVVNMQSYFKPEPPSSWDAVAKVLYRIGPIRVSRVFKEVSINGMTFPGEQERAVMPVTCSFVYKEGME